MILKVKDAENGWIIRGEIERLHHRWIDKKEIEETRSTIDELMLVNYDKQPEKDGKKQYNPYGEGAAVLLIFKQRGKVYPVEWTLIANTAVFVCNDDGRTIELI